MNEPREHRLPSTIKHPVVAYKFLFRMVTLGLFYELGVDHTLVGLAIVVAMILGIVEWFDLDDKDEQVIVKLPRGAVVGKITLSDATEEQTRSEL